jgi:hypothetical protein
MLAALPTLAFNAAHLDSGSQPQLLLRAPEEALALKP